MKMLVCTTRSPGRVLVIRLYTDAVGSLRSLHLTQAVAR